MSYRAQEASEALPHPGCGVLPLAVMIIIPASSAKLPAVSVQPSISAPQLQTSSIAHIGPFQNMRCASINPFRFLSRVITKSLFCYLQAVRTTKILDCAQQSHGLILASALQACNSTYSQQDLAAACTAYFGPQAYIPNGGFACRVNCVGRIVLDRAAANFKYSTIGGFRTFSTKSNQSSPTKLVLAVCHRLLTSGNGTALC